MRRFTELQRRLEGVKSKDSADVIVSVTKKGKLSEKHDTTGPNRRVFAYFPDALVCKPPLVSGTYMYRALLGFLVGVEI
jgi:hypothetical protein